MEGRVAGTRADSMNAGSLKLVARGEEACSAGPAASAALLADAPVQCLRYERPRPCQSNHSLQSFFVWV